ncbi:GSCOCG00012181001-RA-CDS, partial [Cotesia congregata]
ASSITLSEDLRFWLSENSISQQAANKLIGIFRNHGHQNELKKDVRTLMKTPRDVTGKIVNGNGGSYFHFGITHGLTRSINKYYNVCPATILIQLNCDGMSFSKSSSSQFWPLLAAIKADFYSEPVLVGLFHRYSKPNNFTPLFIFVKNASRKMDARAYLTLTKSHSGYFGCSKCTQQGEWGNYVNFPEINSPLRTDESFKSQMQEEHHSGESLLLDLDFGMVSQIPLDYQHLVCLGVAKRYLLRLTNGSRAHRLTNDQIEDFNEALQAMKTCIPLKFVRKPRLLDSVAKW